MLNMCNIILLEYVSGIVGIDEEGRFILVWYTHNNQLFIDMKMGDGYIYNNILCIGCKSDHTMHIPHLQNMEIISLEEA